jgi:hypothetical protein
MSQFFSGQSYNYSGSQYFPGKYRPRQTRAGNFGAGYPPKDNMYESIINALKSYDIQSNITDTVMGVVSMPGMIHKNFNYVAAALYLIFVHQNSDLNDTRVKRKIFSDDSRAMKKIKTVLSATTKVPNPDDNQWLRRKEAILIYFDSMVNYMEEKNTAFRPSESYLNRLQEDAQEQLDEDQELEYELAQGGGYGPSYISSED